GWCPRSSPSRCNHPGHHRIPTGTSTGMCQNSRVHVLDFVEAKARVLGRKQIRNVRFVIERAEAELRVKHVLIALGTKAPVMHLRCRREFPVDVLGKELQPRRDRRVAKLRASVPSDCESSSPDAIIRPLLIRVTYQAL